MWRLLIGWTRFARITDRSRCPPQTHEFGEGSWAGEASYLGSPHIPLIRHPEVVRGGVSSLRMASIRAWHLVNRCFDSLHDHVLAAIADPPVLGLLLGALRRPTHQHRLKLVDFTPRFGTAPDAIVEMGTHAPRPTLMLVDQVEDDNVGRLRGSVGFETESGSEGGVHGLNLRVFALKQESCPSRQQTLNTRKLLISGDKRWNFGGDGAL